MEPDVAEISEQLAVRLGILRFSTGTCVGAALRIVAQTSLGELVTTMSAPAAYRLWANTYDLDLNPLVALEQRVLSEHLNLIPGERLMDLATGTGRWLEHALARDTRRFG